MLKMAEHILIKFDIGEFRKNCWAISIFLELAINSRHFLWRPTYIHFCALKWLGGRSLKLGNLQPFTKVNFWQKCQNCYTMHFFLLIKYTLKNFCSLKVSKANTDCVHVPDCCDIRLFHDGLHALSSGVSGIRSANHCSSKHPAPHKTEDEVKYPTTRKEHQDLSAMQ